MFWDNVSSGSSAQKFAQLLFIGIKYFYQSLTNLEVFKSKFVDIGNVSFSVQG